MNRALATRVLPAGAVLILLAIAGAIGYVIARRVVPAPPQAATTETSQRRVLYWYDPMKPKQHFDHPGLSPMGMQMVPRYASENTAQNIVRINPAEVQNLGMRTARVKVGTLSDTLHVPGTVAWDRKLARIVSARTNMTIDTLYVRAPFTAVNVGQPLVEVLAPQWSAAAAQYFALRDAQSATGKSLRAAARARLHTLGMTNAIIRNLQAGNGTITLRAPIDGVVSELDVKDGQQVGQGMPIMSINGLDQVWVEAAIPQARSAGVQAGTPVVATVSALPGEVFHGKVAKLLPAVDASTRTQRARIVLDNPGHELAPGMFAHLRITLTPGARHPLVPTAAIIATGVNSRVIEALGDGQFKPVRVKTGRSADGMTAILAGLHGGERIVTSGQFLIDSEASLSGALQRLGDDPNAASARGLEPLSRRERGGGEGSQESQRSNSTAPSSGASRHVLPQGEEKPPDAMTGMKMDMPMPAASASSGSGAKP